MQLKSFDPICHCLILSDPVRPRLSLLNPVRPSLPRLSLLGNMVLDFLFWTWSMKRSNYTVVNLYVITFNQYRGSQTLTLFHKSVSSSLYWVFTPCPSYGDSYKSHSRAKLVPDGSGWQQLAPFFAGLPLFHTVWPVEPRLAHLDPVWYSLDSFGPV